MTEHAQPEAEQARSTAPLRWDAGRWTRAALPYVLPPLIALFLLGVAWELHIEISNESEFVLPRPSAAFDALFDDASLRSMLPTPAPTFEQLAALADDGSIARSKHSMMLHAIASACEGMSGRALRKLPFLAHACRAPASEEALPVQVYLHALNATVYDELASRRQLANSPGGASAT